MTTRNAIAILAAAALVLGGCAGARPPRLHVADAHVASRTAEGVALAFTIDAENPNEVQLPLREVVYTLSIDGRRVFSGTRSAEATLRPFDTQQIRLPASFGLGEAGVSPVGARPYRLEGSVRYLTPGALAETLFDARVWRPRVAFSESGVIDFGEGP